MVAPTLSLTESQQLTALRGFLAGAVIVPTDILLGQINRVAEPANPDFIVFWPIRMSRLATNETSYVDDIFTASIAGDLMTVTALEQAEGALAPGALLTDGVVGAIAPGTTIVVQVSGSVGGTGVYQVSPSQTLPSGLLYAGTRLDQEAVEWVVQCDVHGPNSANNARVIEQLFRSEVGYDSFVASGYQVVPLYSDEVRQVPFLNAEEAWENRWTLDLHCEIVPIVGTPQQFADQLDVTTLEVDTTYPP